MKIISYIKKIFIKTVKINSYSLMLKGYLNIKKNGKLIDFNKSLYKIQLSKIKQKSSFSYKYFFGEAVQLSELSTRQFLIERILGNPKFNDEFLKSHSYKKKSFIYPLPTEWYEKLFKKNNFKKFVSMYFLYGLALIYFLNGTLFILKVLYLSIINIIKRKKIKIQNYYYYDGLGNSGFPYFYEKSSKKMKCLYESFTPGNLDKKINVFYGPTKQKNIKNNKNAPTFQKSPFYYFYEIKPLLQFIFWSFINIFKSLTDLILRGDWVQAFMLKEGSKAALVRYNNPKYLAKCYYFNNSSQVYRPLWTYEAERKNSCIILYYYATNIEYFEENKKTPIFPGFYIEIMSWTNYLVWDEDQKFFLNDKVMLNCNIDIVGPIILKANTITCKLPENTIGLFDVAPKRPLKYYRYCFSFDYYILKYNTIFFDKCMVAINNFDLIPFMKRKRDIGKMEHKGYTGLIKKHSSNGLIELNHETFLYDMIKQCKMVISQPFTSPTRMAKSMGIPSVFFDPTKKIDLNDPAAGNIKIINDVNELKKWISNNMN